MSGPLPTGKPIPASAPVQFREADSYRVLLFTRNRTPCGKEVAPTLFRAQQICGGYGLTLCQDRERLLFTLVSDELLVVSIATWNGEHVASIGAVEPVA